MEDLILLLIDFFAFLYAADERPESRRFVVGCLVVVLLLCVVAALAWGLW